MKLTKDNVPFVFALGAIVCGPVSTMIISPERFGAYYAYGAIDALLVGFAIQWLSEGLQNIWKPHEEDGSSPPSVNENGK